MAGGGGGGGRISINSTAYSFSGSLSASGGFRPITYDTESIAAGAGTIFLSISNRTVLVTALIVSSNAVSNYSFNLFNKVGISLPYVIQRSYPAYIFDSIDGIDIHILGNARASFSGSFVTLTGVIASGFPSISLISGTLVRFSPYFSVRGFQMDLLNCTVARGSNVSISTNGYILLHSASSSLNSPAGIYVLDYLEIINGGCLYGKDVSIITDTFRINSSSIQVENTVKISGSLSEFIDSSLVGSSATSSLEWDSSFIRITGNLIFNVSLAVNGSMSINGTLTGVSDASLTLSTLSSVSTAAYSVMDLKLYSSGIISVDTNSSLLFKGYGLCVSNCSFEIPTSSVLNFSGFFDFESSGSIIGNGMLVISGKLSNPPPLLESLELHVDETGILFFNSSGESYVHSNHFLVFGKMMVYTVVNVHNLNCSGQIAAVDNGLLNFYSNLVLQDGCSLLGDGVLQISQSAFVFSGPMQPMVNVLHANIVNYGEIIADEGVISFSQGSQVSNYGNIIIRNQVWSSVLGSSSFQKYHSVESVGDFGVKTLLNASLETCATLCLEDLLPVERYTGPPPPIIDYFACRLFEYFPHLDLCRFHIELPAFTEAAFIDPFAVDLYVRVPAWANPSVLKNYAYANVTIASGSLGNLNMFMENNGAVLIPPETTLVFSNAYEQNSTGVVLGEGTILFNGSNNNLRNDFYAPEILMNITGCYLDKCIYA